jgi:hypothetical protein
VRRREFISLIGGASVVLPLAARAQRLDRVMRIGVLGPRPENTGISGGVAAGYPAMLDELRKLGFSEGRRSAGRRRCSRQAFASWLGSIVARSKLSGTTPTPRLMVRPPESLAVCA